MSLVSLKEIMTKHDGAVGAFSTYDMFTAQGIIKGAEEANLPVILMIGEVPLLAEGNLEVARVMIKLAKEAKVDACVFLDHSRNIETCKMAVDMGFSAVMIDASHADLEENISLTNMVTEYAKKAGVSVEAELGALAGIEDGVEVKDSKMTTVSQVKGFLDRTDVDALAVSIGNAHGLYKGIPNLNFKRLEEIKEVSKDKPLVLHGGTGITDEQFAKGISMGIKKVNIGTEVKRQYMDGFVRHHAAKGDAY
ncbi:MAG: class II fructose-bisphosphate aldolase, partial [Clostridia bacterium]|nr:class II fructose-bisphosphate aldolase [Clostridia bacterium]